MSKKGDGWNLQTNLKNKPNAQGTLFSGGASQIPAEKRYPRGYTPERMRAVEQSTIVEGMQTGHLGQYRTTRQGILDNLARSSAPLKDIEGFHVSVANPDQSEVMSKMGVGGEYRKQSGFWGSATIHMSRVDGPTVIHELGHHASAKDRTWHATYGTPRQRGEEEGFADHYADEHFRTHPEADKRMLDDQRRGRANYDPQRRQYTSADGTERYTHFRDGYDYQRPHEGRVPNDTDVREDRARALSQGRLDSMLDRRKNRPYLPGLDNGSIMRQAASGTYAPPTPRARTSGQLPPPPPPK